ncbi:MAG: hypothetical protein ACE5HZ_02455 [Fidelibacterota bacterium]
MAIALAAVFLGLLILYFVWETARDQELDIHYSTTYTPKETVLETQLDIEAPLDIIWETLVSLRDYHLWFPWIRRVQVTNKSAKRWAHRHSFLRYTVEVGSRFQIRPFFLSPLTSCRFITLDPRRTLSMEMRFFPMVREIVTFTLTPFTNLVQAQYRSVSPSALGFIAQALFSWRGRRVLLNLQRHIPELPLVEEVPREAPKVEKEEKAATGETHIQELVARAFKEGKEVLDGIPDRSLRARAKSAYVRAKRSGDTPAVPQQGPTPEEKTASTAPSEQPTPQETPPGKKAETDQDTIIQEAVRHALEGDMEVINNISDRVLRARAKSAYMKAKREKS